MGLFRGFFVVAKNSTGTRVRTIGFSPDLKRWNPYAATLLVRELWIIYRDFCLIHRSPMFENGLKYRLGKGFKTGLVQSGLGRTYFGLN